MGEALTICTSYTTGFELRREMTAEERELQRRWQYNMMMSRIRDKERNMMTRLERRRAAIRGRWRERGRAALWVAAMALIVPVCGVLIALAWNALWSVTL